MDGKFSFPISGGEAVALDVTCCCTPSAAEPWQGFSTQRMVLLSLTLPEASDSTNPEKSRSLVKPAINEH